MFSFLFDIFISMKMENNSSVFHYPVLMGMYMIEKCIHENNLMDVTWVMFYFVTKYSHLIQTMSQFKYYMNGIFLNYL